MPWKESEVVPERNGTVPQQEKVGSGQPSLADVYRPSNESFYRQQLKLMKSHFEQQEKTLDKLMDGITRLLDQHVASLEHDARHHGGRRARKPEDSRAHGGRRYWGSRDAWG